MRPIDADYILEGLSHLNDNRVDPHFIYGINTAVEMIENAPTIDPDVMSERGALTNEKQQKN